VLDRFFHDLCPAAGSGLVAGTFRRRSEGKYLGLTGPPLDFTALCKDMLKELLITVNP